MGDEREGLTEQLLRRDKGISELQVRVEQLTQELERVNGISGKLMIARDSWREKARRLEAELKECRELHAGLYKAGIRRDNQLREDWPR